MPATRCSEPPGARPMHDVAACSPYRYMHEHRRGARLPACPCSTRPLSSPGEERHPRTGTRSCTRRRPTFNSFRVTSPVRVVAGSFARVSSSRTCGREACERVGAGWRWPDDLEGKRGGGDPSERDNERAGRHRPACASRLRTVSSGPCCRWSERPAAGSCSRSRSPGSSVPTTSASSPRPRSTSLWRCCSSTRVSARPSCSDDDLDDGDVRSVASLNLLLALGLMVVTLVLAPFVADFFHTPELTTVLRVLGVGLVVKGLTIVPLMMSRRVFQFRELAILQTVGVVVGGVAGLVAVAVGPATGHSSCRRSSATPWCSSACGMRGLPRFGLEVAPAARDVPLQHRLCSVRSCSCSPGRTPTTSSSDASSARPRWRTTRCRTGSSGSRSSSSARPSTTSRCPSSRASSTSRSVGRRGSSRQPASSCCCPGRSSC